MEMCSVPHSSPAAFPSAQPHLAPLHTCPPSCSWWLCCPPWPAPLPRYHSLPPYTTLNAYPKVREMIIISLFDEVEFDDRGRGGYLDNEETARREKHFLGSVALPFQVHYTAK